MNFAYVRDYKRECTQMQDYYGVCPHFGDQKFPHKKYTHMKIADKKKGKPDSKTLTSILRKPAGLL